MPRHRPVEGEPARSPAQRRADALADVCRFFLDYDDESIAPRTRPHLDIVVGLEKLERCLPGETLDGATLDGPTLRRLACDADVHRVIVSPLSAVLDYGRKRRLVSDSQRRALNLRDRHCRFPGCSRPVEWCEAHHLRGWPDGGRTDLINLALLCSRHHHLVHIEGWKFFLSEDNTFVVITPTGRELRSRPPPLALAA